jgi:glycosyltransferase involved in cell wall biosynthesis
VTSPRTLVPASVSSGLRTDAPRVGFVSGVLEGTGGLELLELTAARGLADRGWDVVCVYDEPGDLLGRWSETATVRHRDAEALADVDLLYVHDTNRLPAALEIGQRIGRPVVGHLHLPPFHHRGGFGGRVFGRRRYAVDEDVLGATTRVDRFIAVSEHTGRMWVESGLPADRVTVVHNGVDIERFRPARPGEREAVRQSFGIEDDVFVVGFVGRLERMKGLKELMRAFGAVDAATDRRMRLLVVGGPSRRMGGKIGAAKDAFVTELHRSAPPRTSWLGRRGDVESLYRAMDLVVVPSQWEEPFGLVAAEALASGVPVVGTRRGGLAEILTGRLAADLVGTSWRDIAQGIRRHVEQPSRGPSQGAEGRRVIAAHFDVNQTVQGIEQVLRGVS